jgi:23S rRNA (cytosine1962-C5)-methyltransferase
MRSHQPLEELLSRALDARTEWLAEPHQAAFRLFSGFYEGWPELAVDVYARTLVLHNYADPPAAAQAALRFALDWLTARLPWVRAAVVKPRHAATPDERGGALVLGAEADREIREHGVRYALDLRLNQDTSFYIDTRGLRAWAQTRLRDKTALNAFAYTGSLGAAALAGGARRVVQLDRNRAFLEVAKASYRLNGFAISRGDFRVNDFWREAAALKRAGALFDGVFLDPPFFAADRTGIINLNTEGARLINKVRPLIGDGGWLVAVNNALFVSGADYLRSLEALCADGFLSIEELIPVPLDVAGFPETRVGAPPADPAPFNHATKIAVLRVKRKDGHRADDVIAAGR